MKKLLSFCSLLVAVSATAQTNVFPLLTVGGEVYKNAKLISFTMTNALFFHDNGAVRIAFSNLPTSIQNQYGYDPEKIAAMERAGAEQNALRISNSVAQAAASADKWLKEHPQESLAQEVSAPGFSQRINCEFDKFDDTTECRAKFPIKPNREMEVFCVAVTKLGSAGPSFWLHLANSSEDWQYIKYSDFTIIYDGQRKAFGELKDDGDVLSGGSVLEQMTADFTREEFHAIAYAKSVEAKLGSKRLSFDFEARNDWRLLSDHFGPGESK